MYLRSATAALLFGLIALATSEARAQCAFDQSYPNANEVIRDLQAPIMLQFLMEFELQDVRLYGEDRTEWPVDWVRSTAEVQKTEFRPTKPLPPGNYLIEWNGYLRQHYHPDGGSVAFTVAAADAPITPAATSPANSAPQYGPGSRYPALLGAGAPQPGR